MFLCIKYASIPGKVVFILQKKKLSRHGIWEFAAPYFSVFHILFTLRTRLIVLVGKGRLRSAEKWQFLLLFPHSDAPNGTYMVMAPQITSPLNISPVFALLTFFADFNRNCRIRKIAVLHPIGLYIYNLILSLPYTYFISNQALPFIFGYLISYNFTTNIFIYFKVLYQNSHIYSI